MKSSKKKNKVIFWVLIVSLVVILIGVFWGYVRQFNGGLSNDQSIWGAFGDFFNGVISPIFAAINIGIFWYLTTVIDDNNEKRRQQDAEHQKAMILMQFRKAEIDRLEDALQESMLIPDSSKPTRVLQKLALASAYLTTFIKSKLGLFGKDQNSDLNSQLSELLKAIINYNNFIEPIIYSNRVMTKKEKEDMQDLIKIIMFKKIEIVSDLQKITLEK